MWTGLYGPKLSQGRLSTKKHVELENTAVLVEGPETRSHVNLGKGRLAACLRLSFKS